MTHSGSLALVLTHHVPYLLSESAEPLESERLFRDTCEATIPFLRVLNRASGAGASPVLTLALSPVLLEQWASTRFPPRLHAYLEERTDAAEAHAASLRKVGRDVDAELADRWSEYYRGIREDFTHWLREDIVAELKRRQEEGTLEIVPCAATCPDPRLLSDELSRRVQIEVARSSYRNRFGVEARGFWIPSHPGLRTVPLQEDVLTLLGESGVEYVILEGEVDVSSEDRATTRPVILKGDPLLTLEVTQPGVGFVSAPEYLSPLREKPGHLRLWSASREVLDEPFEHRYSSDAARGRAAAQARDFVEQLQRRARALASAGRVPPCLLIWPQAPQASVWFEGSDWLYSVLLEIARKDEIDSESCGVASSRWADVWEESPSVNEALCVPAPVSEYAQGVSDMRRELGQLTRKPECAGDSLRKILSQMSRELLLLEAPEWRSDLNASQEASTRLASVAGRFYRLRELALSLLAGGALTRPDRKLLEEIEAEDDLFPTLEPELGMGPAGDHLILPGAESPSC